MMPLSMSGAGEAQIIKKIGGKEEVRSFLEKLGFVVGGEVTVISEIAGNMIVNVKGARVAIGRTWQIRSWSDTTYVTSMDIACMRYITHTTHAAMCCISCNHLRFKRLCI